MFCVKTARRAHGYHRRMNEEKMPDIGQTVNDRYEIVNLIARGGTSCVYLVLDRHIGRMLAMKVIGRLSVGSFYFATSEIEALRRVRYPLIPVIWDAFYDIDNIYIVSDYVKGDSLGKLCRGKGLPRAQSLSIAQHICSALIYLHQLKHPMLYLDLKPDNIIIGEDGLPHLIDFGIASCLAGHHIPVGTIGYSPPEQYDAGAKLDARADIYAFGMTYYAIRSGVVPDPDPEKALGDILHSRILGSSEKSFLARCCCPSREDRYTEANEVLKQIRHIRSIPQKIKKSIEITIITAGILVSAYYITEKLGKTAKESAAARELAADTAVYMRDGGYSPEGISLIRTAIAGGSLPEDCEQYYIFEVAMNAMFVEHDYRTASRYFSMLDERMYPDASDYVRLCGMQSGFDYDREEAAVITGELFASTIRRRPSAQKYEILIFVAECCENYEEDEAEGLAKSIAVIEAAKQDIEDAKAKETMPDDEECERMCSRLEELLEVKKARMRAVSKKRLERRL